MSVDDHADSFLKILGDKGSAFDVRDADDPRPLDVQVREIRRRRGRVADDRESGHRAFALKERDGVLYWDRPVTYTTQRRGVRRRGRASRAGFAPDGSRTLKEVTVPVLEPNEYLKSLQETDRTLNGDFDAGVRIVRRDDADKRKPFVASRDLIPTTFAGKTLVIVHGTFSNSNNVLGEFAATEEGEAFLNDALKTYNQVLVFDHPTLSVSPILNAIDVSRRMAGTKGKLDVIAHSRGGVVTQWWLEVFGDGLADAEVRAVLAGAPLNGTSLAAPNRIQPIVSLLANIGAFVDKTLGVAAAANPFALASLALLKFFIREERNRWGVPPIEDLGKRQNLDAAVAVIPGLHGQSAVDNNFELRRLRTGSPRVNVDYFALTANFEPEKVGWKLWKVLGDLGDRAKDALTDKIFPGENDLVVDTAHMTWLAEKRHITDVHQFPTSTVVHHLNYFRQREAIASLRTWLNVPQS